STDGKNWTNIDTEKTPENLLKINLKMPADSVFVARLEPYRISDLEQLKSEISDHPLISITEIGKTVENRSLEIIRVGHESVPYSVFIRGRAHAWEPGGNWVIQGLIKRLLKQDEITERYLQRYCVYILPMANKDRVAHGGTRFNMRGMDLNRKWDKEADPYLSPENASFEKWLDMKVSEGSKPDLVIDFHNDSEGQIHIARPDVNIDGYIANMKVFETLLKEQTWFTEGSTGGKFRTIGSIGEGMVERFGIDAFVFELNANWIAGLNKVPFGKDWELFGEQLCEVFYEYFDKKTSK
ncbi:M14 family zinc carboxypeptidase, partial [Bacteroidota bacterium]